MFTDHSRRASQPHPESVYGNGRCQVTIGYAWQLWYIKLQCHPIVYILIIIVVVRVIVFARYPCDCLERI